VFGTEWPCFLLFFPIRVGVGGAADACWFVGGGDDSIGLRDHRDKICNCFADGEGVTADDLVDRLGNRG